MATNNTAPMGVTGLSHYGGVISEEFLRELQGPKWARAVAEMTSQDAIIGATLLALQMLVRQVQFTVQPASDEADATEAAAFVDQSLHDMRETWPMTLAEVLSFLPWGWSALNVTYKTRSGRVKNKRGEKDRLRSSKFNDGKAGWASWSPRGQETLDYWEFDEGEPVGFWQLAPPDYEHLYVPLGKCLHFKTTSRKGNPEGYSALRNAYRSWYFKKKLENIEGIGIERDLAGLPVAWVPPELLAPNAGATEVAILAEVKKIVTGIRRDEQEGVVFPKAFDSQGNQLYDLTLLSTGGSRQFDTDKIIGRYNVAIASSMLADVILLGHEKVGSFSLASSKTTLLATALGAHLDMICGVINADGIPDLIALNGIDEALTPTLTHDDIEHVDLEALGTFIKQVADTGFSLASGPGADQRFIHLLQQAGIPAPKPEELEAEVTEQQQAPPPPPNGRAPVSPPDGEQIQQATEPDDLDQLLDATERAALAWAREVVSG